MGIDKSFNGKDLVNDENIWLIKRSGPVIVLSSPRINIDYATKSDVQKARRFKEAVNKFLSVK